MMFDEKSFEKHVAIWLGEGKSQKGRSEEWMSAIDALYASGPDSERMLKAQETLRLKLTSIHSPKVYYDIMQKSPIGSIFIAIDDRGIVALEIGGREANFKSRVEQKFKAVLVRSPEKVAGVIKQLEEYFEGKRSSFKLNLYFEDLSHFHQQVLRATLDIPQGQITTYGEIARRLGKEQWARAVGQALARNPIPILIPCHRVLASDGSLHGYSGGKGIETKKKLLILEGAL